MIKLMFIRGYGKIQPRGYIADVPFNSKLSYLDPFIIVEVDEKIITKDMMVDDSIRLNLPKLMELYPSEQEEYLDENGDTKTRTNYGYFHAEGKSTLEGCPVITVDDVLRGGVDEQ